MFLLLLQRPSTIVKNKIYFSLEYVHPDPDKLLVCFYHLPIGEGSICFFYFHSFYNPELVNSNTV